MDVDIISQYCLYDYCISSQWIVDLGKHPDAQCSMNRAGRLCGGCKENYSLAVGSSHCIHCPNNNNNNNLALLFFFFFFFFFFLATVFLLVFFVLAFNLIVTQGMISGLIFYANFLSTYQSILFPKYINSNIFFTSLRVFIAWLNVNFGMQVYVMSKDWMHLGKHGCSMSFPFISGVLQE